MFVSLSRLFLLLALTACATDSPTGIPDSEIIVESKAGSSSSTTICAPAVHEKYVVKGPDGAMYPTWHPPNDPATGCSFAHEHGRDPRGSALFATVGHIPFGYANARLDIYDPANMRHEDHVGHKIEWENNVRLQRSVAGVRTDIGVQCDFLVKVHQGTHSPDAFTNNLHELAYFVKCTDGTEIRATLLSAIGRPGEFVRSCDKTTVVAAGSPIPATSPVGGGVRFIPDASCVEKFILVPEGSWSQYSLALYEDWITSNYLRTADGRQLAYFDPHFAVFSPSRYYDSALTNHLGRTLGACYLEQPVGERARGGECERSTNYGQLTNLTFDDPRSAFNGAKREMYFNQTTITNRGGPSAWYTDPFGGRASATEFPGSIKQFIASVDNTRPYPLESQAFGATRNYGSVGTRAPN